MDINEQALDLHYQLQGKIEVVSRKHIETRQDLSLMYTPGVAEPCRVSICFRATTSILPFRS